MSQNNSLAMFENETIGKLMLKFSLPAIASMVVNSIYNIVDQIFIGQGVGMYGNAATNLTFPLVTIAMAIGTLIADGCVAYFSLKLGQKNYDEAARTMGNGITISLLAGLFITLSMELLLTPVLNLCGGAKVAEETFRYATEYARITLIGIPFVCISMTVNSIIRAQGNPRYAMISNISGCLLNVVLDAWFVLGLGWGVAGAARATIIGQILNFVLAVYFNFNSAAARRSGKLRLFNLGLHASHFVLHILKLFHHIGARRRTLIRYSCFHILFSLSRNLFFDNKIYFKLAQFIYE